MKAAASLPLLFLLACCSLLDPDFPGGHSRTEGGSPARDSVFAQDEGHIWLSAVEYPEGYDWKRDTARGVVPCRLVLFRDGKQVVEIVLRQEGVTPEADMHRIAGGHLYTDYVTPEGETVIGCDGTERFRYPGRELIRGFLLDGGAVYTLGQNRDGPGFSYRKDGIALFTCSDAVPVGAYGPGSRRSGALYRDNDALCFAWYTTTEKRHYRLWRDGDIRELELPEGSTLFDIRSVQGQDIVTYGSNGRLLLRRGEESKKWTPNAAVTGCRILPDPADDQWGFSLLARLRRPGGKQYDVLIRSSGAGRTLAGANYSTDYQLLPGGEAGVSMNPEGKVACIEWMGLTDTTAALRYRILMGPQCIYFTENEALVALTGDFGQNGASPAIWNRGELRTVLLSGYLTGIAYD